jgi:hypothetical protein
MMAFVRVNVRHQIIFKVLLVLFVAEILHEAFEIIGPFLLISFTCSIDCTVAFLAVVLIASFADLLHILGALLGWAGRACAFLAKLFFNFAQIAAFSFSKVVATFPVAFFAAFLRIVFLTLARRIAIAIRPSERLFPMALFGSLVSLRPALIQFSQHTRQSPMFI